ncbi:hypothetical protein B0H10DRAFT_2184589 [Mycena sp. CBHHK59/15]|nr:hypothetical protein B0H10DRAFT_2184589 [Mycena sp. CBHHK59/15]
MQLHGATQWQESALLDAKRQESALLDARRQENDLRPPMGTTSGKATRTERVVLTEAKALRGVPERHPGHAKKPRSRSGCRPRQTAPRRRLISRLHQACTATLLTDTEPGQLLIWLGVCAPMYTESGRATVDFWCRRTITISMRQTIAEEYVHCRFPQQQVICMLSERTWRPDAPGAYGRQTGVQRPCAELLCNVPPLTLCMTRKDHGRTHSGCMLGSGVGMYARRSAGYMHPAVQNVCAPLRRMHVRRMPATDAHPTSDRKPAPQMTADSQERTYGGIDLRTKRKACWAGRTATAIKARICVVRGLGRDTADAHTSTLAALSQKPRGFRTTRTRGQRNRIREERRKLEETNEI